MYTRSQPYALSTRVSRYPRRRVVEERWRTSTKSFLPRLLPYRAAPGRAFYSGASQASLWHVSPASLYPSRTLPLFHPLERTSPTAKRAKRGWLEGKRICDGGQKGVSEGTSGSRPDRHSRNDFVLRACLIMNPHPGEAPPPFARRTTTSGSSSREFSGGEVGHEARVKRARWRRKRLLPAARWPSFGLNCTVYYPCGISNYLFLPGRARSDASNIFGRPTAHV